MSLELDGVNGIIKNTTSDGDVTIKGNDGGSEISAVTFDMSTAGKATFNNDIAFGDNQKAVFGASEDLQIFHNGSDSYIKDAGTGNLRLEGTDVRIANSGGTGDFLRGTNGGATDLCHNGSVKISTASGGVDITGGFTATAASTITSSSAGDLLTLKSTDAGAEAGPNLVLFRDSASPANDDVIGRIRFEGDDNEGNKTVYAQLTSQIIDKGSSGGEDSTFQMEVFNNGALRDILTVKGATGGTPEIVFNESSQNVDFRVESNNKTHALFVDAGNDRIGVGTDSPVQTMHIRSMGNPSNDTGLILEGNATDSNVALYFYNSAGTEKGRFLYDTDDNNLHTSVNGSERNRIKSTGTMDINVGGATDNTNEWTMKLRQTANASATHYMIVFAKQNDTTVGSIQTDGSNTSFNTSSDYRLKENVIDLTNAIDRIKTLQPKRFNFKDNPNKTQDGFIAHEVTAVPEAVTGEKDATKTYTNDNGNEETIILPQQLDQSKLIPLLTSALQEAITRIETLETKVAALEG